MKAIITILVGLIVFPLQAQESIETQPEIYCVDGIYYSVLSDNPREVAVVCNNREHIYSYISNMKRGLAYYDWMEWEGNTYQGEIVIPASITIPELGNYSLSVTSIADAAFIRCNDLKSILIPNTIIAIGKGAFEYCETLSEVIIPDSVKYVGSRAFSACYNLMKMHFSKGCHYINESTLSLAGYHTGIEIDGLDSISGIDWYGLAGCGIKEFPYMPSLESVGICGVAKSHLQQLDLSYIENGQDLFNSQGFDDNEHLKTIILPISVPDYVDFGFNNCHLISYIKIFNITPPALLDNWASKVAKGCVVDVPDESVEVYRNAPYWNEFIIKGHSASVEDAVFEDVRIEFNRGVLNLNAPYSVKVFDLTGKLYAEGKSIALTLKSGIYIVSAKGYNRKIVVD